MKRITALTLIAASLISCSKINGKGEITTIESAVNSAANSISISSAMNLTLSDELQPGELSISAHENIHQYIKISNTSDALDIELKRGNYTNLNIDIVASSKQYNDIEASGASKVTISGAEASFSDYEIDLSGASSFGGELDIANTLDIDLSGASKVNLAGRSHICKADLSGASKLGDTSFECDALGADLSGASSIEMSISTSISGELTGSSSIRYKGSPIVSAETSSSSIIKQIK